MFNIRVVQANYGDCFILEYGNAGDARFALIDGGPRYVWNNHLEGELKKIANLNGRLDFVAISHVDADHITGVLDFFAELESADASGEARLLEVCALWHNAFTKSVGGGDVSVQTRFASLMDSAGSAVASLQSTEALQGIWQGNQLRIKAAQLGVDINASFPDDLIIADTAPAIEIENIKIRVVGPTQENLDELRKEWIAWIEDNEEQAAAGSSSFLANSDKSVPNLSSLMFYVEADGKTALFTGDGRSDHLLQGLDQTGLLDADGKLHVDILKVMHHASDRNVTRTFFKTVTADTYIVSANGHPDNPDLSTLIWMVEAAKSQEREIKIIATNETRSTRKLVEEYDPDEYGYDLEVMPDHWHYRLIELG